MGMSAVGDSLIVYSNRIEIAFATAC